MLIFNRMYQCSVVTFVRYIKNKSVQFGLIKQSKRKNRYDSGVPRYEREFFF